MRLQNTIADVAASAPLVGACRRVLRRTLQRVILPAAVKQGQSLTEMALLLPILLLFVLGSVNLGLGLQAHTELTQNTQQAAQYLLEHSSGCAANGIYNGTTGAYDAATGTYYKSCLERQVIGYLQSQDHKWLDYSQCSAAGSGQCTVTVTFGTQLIDSTTNQYEFTCTITVKYLFPLTLPMPRQVYSGLQNGIPLNAQVATILLTNPPTISGPPSATYAGATFTGYTISWSAPSEWTNVIPSGAALRYRIYSYGQLIYTTLPTAALNPSYSDPCGTSSAQEPPCTPSPSPNYFYQVSAVLPNGMESPLSPQVQKP